MGMVIRVNDASVKVVELDLTVTSRCKLAYLDEHHGGTYPLTSTFLSRLRLITW
jgi:hypothetical protein